ncbi:MAG: methyltransferase domain-containing protein [Leptospira sp.]|nr:methyltransferase domain-containing protein [Leptospira sp.]
MKNTILEMRDFFLELRNAYKKKENVMAKARELSSRTENSSFATLVAYDLQSGNYVARAKENPVYREKWGNQLGKLIEPWIETGDLILEVGVGEATTLAYVYQYLKNKKVQFCGFDISWSRIDVGKEFLREMAANADLFVADLFNIPFADNSIDIVYTAHSLEPNGGRELEALSECLRIARKAVILVEPAFELGTEEARERMIANGYVRGLRDTAEKLGANVADYRLLEVFGNQLNPSAVLTLTKKFDTMKSRSKDDFWVCPITSFPLEKKRDLFFSSDAGLAYPILRDIPLLRAEHAIIASRLTKSI